MEYLLIEYPKCSTCQKAKKWLQEHNILFEDRHIVENCPTQKELEQWILKSGKPIKSFFNTSGILYRQMQLKDTLETRSKEEQIALLAENGMLIKRPLLVGKEVVLIGFRKQEWEETLSK